MKQYDIGIVGYWYATNYGSIITYYALSLAINKLGYSTVLIDEPEKWKDPEGEDVISRKFLSKHCNISDSLPWEKQRELNDLCRGFVIGSDQVWTNSALRHMRYMFFLSFANDDKKKIAYAPSFGKLGFFDPTPEQEVQVRKYLSRFDKISVREDSGRDMVRNRFGLRADQTLDPVFLLSRSDYDKVSDESNLDTSGNYILVYILDPNPDKEKFILKASSKLSLKVKIVLDGRKGTFTRNREKIVHFSDDEILQNVSEADWIKLFRNASYVLTDSHHGLAMAVIYNKNFICYANYSRGYDRFVSLLSLLGLMDRMIENTSQLDDELFYNNIDYERVNTVLAREKEKSLNWIRDAIETPKEKLPSIFLPQYDGVSPEIISEIEKMHSNRDFKNIRILATLFRDYGIKHIVLSPGGRNVPLVRMFENNADKFILHHVTDERSAAYYGMGIAAQLRQPVACVCTSGTAASNYLPAVTEAYYTGIPLIVITADRYNVYLNHGEDQTIPQKHIYSGVVKMEVTLPEADGWRNDYQARRDIASCILESTHNGMGPVHINVPVDNISVGAKLEKKYWDLMPYIYPHILRVGFNNGPTDMMRWVDSLKKSNKILVVYGQNVLLTERQKNNIREFASKYNCVFVTDSISNFHGEYTLMPHNMLQSISQDIFNKELSPDILITVGGKRLMNDPLTFKVRNGLGNIRHWSVTPDGKIKDFYFRLTSVIESTDDYFFEWFSKNAGEIRNNGIYYEKWRNLTEKYSSPVITQFNSLYIQSKFLPAIPKGSILHLGVGQTFIECRRFHIDESVEVYCNMGTNGIDGCTSTFMGQCAVVDDRLCFLLVGDLSFFYDMNSIWNKPLKKNMRILLVNNNGTGLLRGHNLQAISSVHNTSAEGWVNSTGFNYISAHNKEEFEEKLNYFLSNEPGTALFFEVFCE